MAGPATVCSDADDVGRPTLFFFDTEGRTMLERLAEHFEIIRRVQDQVHQAQVAILMIIALLCFLVVLCFIIIHKLDNR